MSKVTIVGVTGRDGDQIKWFGNNVSIQGVPCVLFRVEYVDGTRGEFYAPSFEVLFRSIGIRECAPARSVRYCGA